MLATCQTDYRHTRFVTVFLGGAQDERGEGDGVVPKQERDSGRTVGRGQKSCGTVTGYGVGET